MAILVTGGKGYLGSALIKRLIEKDLDIVCLDLKATPGRLGGLKNRVKIVGGGINGVDELVKLIGEHKIDRIAHMVFFWSTPGQTAEIQTEISTMVMGTVNVFEAARLTGVKRILFPSSIHYYGPQWLHGEVLLNEDSPSLAETIYGIGKKLNEVVAYTYNMRAGMNIVSMRLPAIYGPGARVGARGVNIAAVECALGKPAVFPYQPLEKVCVAHVDDVVTLLSHALMTDNLEHYAYNVGGHTVSYWELATIVREFVPDAQISFEEATGRSDLPYLIDDSRIRKEFGFKHRSLREGYLNLINLTRREAGLPGVNSEPVRMNLKMSERARGN